MLASLPYDLLNKVMIFLEPKEVITLYECSKDVIKETMEETNFIVECKVIIPDEQVKWFETNNIKINLLEEYNINLFGDQMWYKNGKLHRDKLPAIIASNGDSEWFKNGLRHRDNNLPAIMCTNGRQEWFQNCNN